MSVRRTTSRADLVDPRALRECRRLWCVYGRESSWHCPSLFEQPVVIVHLLLCGGTPRLSEIRAPYYLIDERRLLHNLELVQQVRDRSGAKSVLALKCFATWGVFDLVSQYLDGTTSSR